MVVWKCSTKEDFVEAVVGEELVDEEPLVFLDAAPEQAHQVPMLELRQKDHLVLHLHLSLLRSCWQPLHCNLLAVLQCALDKQSSEIRSKSGTLELVSQINFNVPACLELLCKLVQTRLPQACFPLKSCRWQLVGCSNYIGEILNLPCHLLLLHFLWESSKAGHSCRL